MPRITPATEAENTRIVLSLLESVERDGKQTQRRLATELGIALGLVNAYIKRCVKKGFVKVSEAPTRRYGYYLTPKGFAEKSRLTVEYFTSSFSFFRQARNDCSEMFALIGSRGLKRAVLVGISDLAEIARIAALESDVSIVAVVDHKAEMREFIGLPVFKSFDEVPGDFDVAVITDLMMSYASHADAIARFGDEYVFAPSLLGLGAEPRRPVA